MWNVWRVHYRYYAEIRSADDLPPVLVKAGLSFEAAAALVETLGFGHCMKPG